MEKDKEMMRRRKMRKKVMNRAETITK